MQCVAVARPCSRTGKVNSSPVSLLLQVRVTTLVLWNRLDELVTCSVPFDNTSPTSVHT